MNTSVTLLISVIKCLWYTLLANISCRLHTDGLRRVILECFTQCGFSYSGKQYWLTITGYIFSSWSRNRERDRDRERQRQRETESEREREILFDLHIAFYTCIPIFYYLYLYLQFGRQVKGASVLKCFLNCMFVCI